MENRDAVAMLLKDGVDALERGLFFDHDVGDHPPPFQLVELVLERPSLDFQCRQVASRVGKRKEHDGSIGRHDRDPRQPSDDTSLSFSHEAEKATIQYP